MVRAFVVLPALAAFALAGCVYQSESLDQLRCDAEGQIDGDRRCQDGFWISYTATDDMRLPPEDMNMVPDQGPLPTDMRPDEDMPLDMPAEMGPPDMGDMMVATVCGDGLREGAERCDDGGTAAGDGCSSSCTIEPGWRCDGDSPSRCEPICGDGLVIAGVEACDDMNDRSGDGCSPSCAVEQGWRCDASAPSVCGAICGDGIIVASQEACDDMNDRSGDGCSDTCAFEAGFDCVPNSTPTQCSPVSLVGNGQIDAGESCDDGNMIAGDGCDSQGQLEPAFLCPIEGYSCQHVTGATFGPAHRPDMAGNDGGGGFDHPCPTGSALVGVEGEGDNDNMGRTRMSCQPISISANGRLAWRNPTSYTNWVNGDQSHDLGDEVCAQDSFVIGYQGHVDTGRDILRGVKLRCQGFEVTQGQLRAVGQPATLATYGYNRDTLTQAHDCDPLAVGRRFLGRSDGGNMNAFRVTCQALELIRCGDGRISPGEGCDDGNLTAGDGCDASCEVEPSYTCVDAIASTGADGRGGLLAKDATALGWRSSATLGGAAMSMTVTESCSNWGTFKQDSSTAKWIGHASCNDNLDTRYYALSFNLPHKDLLPALSFAAWADDNINEVSLNGASLNLSANNAYDSQRPLRADVSGFVTGMNTLTFKVQNTGGPGGLLVELPRMLSVCTK